MNLPLLLTLVAAAYLALAIVIAARRMPGYRHVDHTISELGEVGAPNQRLVGWGVFLPVGLALLATATMTRPITQPVSSLALVLAIGYLVAAFFPCDPGSPVTGSLRQGVHNLGGAVQYMGGALALFRLAETHGTPFAAAGMAVGVTGVALSVMTAGRGAAQRVAEMCLFGGLAWAL